MKTSKKNIYITLLFVLIIPLLSLVFGNIYIPNTLNSSDLADWRLLSSIISFGGLLHLGIVDGFYLNWLTGKINNISYYVYFKLLVIITILSTILVLFFNSIFEFKFLTLILLFTSLIIVPLMSLSIAYTQIFLSGILLNFSLISQSLIFIIIVFLSSKYLKLNADLILLSYNLSCLPIIFITIYSDMLKSHNNLSGLKFYMKNGMPLMLSNLGIILFTNLDKIVLRYFITSRHQYAEYTLQSSLFVAGISLGVSIGNVVVSQKIFFRSSLLRVSGLIFTTLVSILLCEPLSEILNKIIKSYTIDYRLALILSMITFYTFAVYFSNSKVYNPRLSQKIFYIFPILYIPSILIVKKINSNYINSVSMILLISYTIISLIIHEIEYMRRKM